MFLNEAESTKNPFWMYLLGSLIIIFFSILGQLPLSFFISGENLISAGGDPILALRNLDKNLQLFLLLIPSLVGFSGLILVVYKLHEKSLKTISTSRKNFDWQRMFFAFFLWSLITVLLLIGDYLFNPSDYQWNFKLLPFIILFIISITLIPIQASFEEYIFRGYLLHGFTSFFKKPWLSLVMTSVIFGCLHFSNPEVEKIGYSILIYYIGTGFFLGILTIIDKGIELALGFHIANNLLISLLLTSSWTAFQTESIFLDISEPSIGFEVIFPLLVLYPLFLFIVSKKYKLSNWKNKLLNT